MPSTLPSFASAAAASGRQSLEGNEFSEWSRRPNGATQTFRRSSLATVSSHNRDSSSTSSTVNPQMSGTYVPPHINAMRNGTMSDLRYSKSQLLDLFKEQRETSRLHDGVSSLFVGDWDPQHSNGTSSNKWSRRDTITAESIITADICWDHNGALAPLTLNDLTDEERELFQTSVNSPLKGPNTTGQREGPVREGGQSLRKLSIPHTQGNPMASGILSPTSTRPSQRRKESSDDELTSLASPLFRRRTDLREIGQDSIAEELDQAPLQEEQPLHTSLKRIATGNFPAPSSVPSSPWAVAPQSATAAPGSAFGSFGLGSGGTGERRPGMARGESRFRSLMARDSLDDVTGSLRDKAVMGGRMKTSDQGDHSEAFISSDQDAEHVGSAALGGESPPLAGSHDLSTPQRNRFAEGAAFSGFSAQRSASGFGIGHTTFTGDQSEEPISPTFTNPYQSPEQRNLRLDDIDSEEPDLQNLHLPGLGGFGGPFAREPAPGQGLSTGMGFAPFDRDHGAAHSTSRGFPNLAGLAGLGGLTNPANWSASVGTPNRDRSAFYDPDPNMRSPRDSQSPSLAGLGSTSGMGPIGGLGAIGRGNSRLGSLLPAAMQEQMRGRDSVSESTEKTDEHHSNIGREAHVSMAPGPASRDTNSPFNHARQEELLEDTSMTGSRSYSPSGLQQASHPHGASQPPSGPQRMPSNLGTSASSQPPAAQQKTMVMPDRIRWIYRDPQGNTQGPWSGLEMHDWYRAGFFSPELLVKKVEDPDFEPLAQLIRRIGNSREPFLVPQIGIPGPPNSTSGTGWPNQSTAQPTGAAAQPPFASSFPSFGTTLTAEQQNALERRKQEEQYLMARQKEHLAQQQFYVKQMQMQSQHGIFPQQLQARSSAQSLSSQPSYGSMTSPVGFPPSTMATSNQHASQVHSPYDNSVRMGVGLGGIGPIGSGTDSLGNIREEPASGLFERLNLGNGNANQYGSSQDRQGLEDAGSQEQRAAIALADRVRLEREQAEAYQRGGNEPQDGQERLQQFKDLRSEMEEQQKADMDILGSVGKLPAQMEGHFEPADEETDTEKEDIRASQLHGGFDLHKDQGLSLTEQVQKAASAKQSPLPAAQDSGPPPSTSPLPAPAARRTRGNVADALAAESPASASPSVETPTTSLAPWARDPAETQKQPSLKDIQEAEARQAAKQEELAAAARRAALEREISIQTNLPAPGLPATSTWASSDTATTSSPSAWTKATVSKTPTGSMNKKTLQQIQKEEEAIARKQKAAVAAISPVVVATVSPSAQSMSAGKRYADLAGKAASPGPTTGPTAWTTVGSSGKTKAPAAPPAPTRTLSNIANTTVPIATRPKATVTQSRATPAMNAMEEFKKWAINELRPEMNKNIAPENLITMLMDMPGETDIVTEVVHQSSSTIDSRHFAEEFVRRRALAEKGKTVPAFGSNPSSHHAGDKQNTGGWNEVARKTPAVVQKDDNNPFKIVAAKKKTGKK